MSEWKVHSALVSAFNSLGHSDDDTAYEQREFTPPDGLYYSLFNLPADRVPLTLGSDGEDDYVGVFQIDVVSKTGEGVRTIIEAAQVLTAFFTAGTWLNKDGQAVFIRRSQMSQPRKQDVRLVVSVSVFWQARIKRQP